MRRCVIGPLSVRTNAIPSRLKIYPNYRLLAVATLTALPPHRTNRRQPWSVTAGIEEELKLLRALFAWSCLDAASREQASSMQRTHVEAFTSSSIPVMARTTRYCRLTYVETGLIPARHAVRRKLYRYVYYAYHYLRRKYL